MKIATLQSNKVIEMKPDHEEARIDAALRQPNSNLARCYLELVGQLEKMGTTTGSARVERVSGDQSAENVARKIIENELAERMVDFSHELAADDILASLASAGYVIVPKEPTDAMLEAAWAYAHDEDAKGVWVAMVEEAQRGGTMTAQEPASDTPLS